MHLQPLYSSPGESVSEEMPDKSGDERPLWPWARGVEGVKRFNNGHARYWPTLKISAQSWFYQSTPTPHFISQFPVKPLFLFLLQPSLSGKLSPATVQQFSQAYSQRWQESDWFVLLQSQICFSLIFLLLPYSISRVFSCLGELFHVSNLMQVSNLMKKGTELATIN